MKKRRREAEPEDVISMTPEAKAAEQTFEELIIGGLREAQIKRKAILRTQNRVENAVRAMLFRAMGWKPEPENTKKQNDKIKADVEKIMSELKKAWRVFSVKLAKVKDLRREAGDSSPITITEQQVLDELVKKSEICKKYPKAIENVGFFALTAFKSLEPFNEMRAIIEKEMVDSVIQLPIWQKFKHPTKDKGENGTPPPSKIMGFTAFGLAVIIGEAGILANYSNPAKLWKRLGLAVIRGHRQGDPERNPTTGKASADLWIEHGYNGQRRSAIWTVTEPIFRHNLYFMNMVDKRKSYEVHKPGIPDTVKSNGIVTRGDTGHRPGTEYESVSKHAENRAKRYVAKRFILLVWCIWNDQTPREDRDELQAAAC